MADIDVEAWYAGKEFTTDWTTPNLPFWADILAARRHEPLRVLEIGSWEGRSAILFLNYLPHCHVTCVDTFAGSVEHHLDPDWWASVADFETRFDRNTSEFGGRVEKVKAMSAHALGRFSIERRRFDVAYIDGSHHSADVFADSALTWPLMSPNAVVIFDDYAWPAMATPEQRPKLGVDTFLTTVPGQYAELHRGYQLIVAKRPA